LDKFTPDSPALTAGVVMVEDVGEMEVVSLQTSTKTFVAEGFFTHNSQIEVRLLAHESRDPVLCKMFIDDRDVHTETAAKIFGVPITDIGKKDVRRFIAKRVTFGIAYGVSGSGLAKQIRMNKTNAQDRDWSVDDCDRLIKEWLKLYKGCASYFAMVEEEVMRTGEVRDYSGMIRYLAAVYSDDPKMASEARRQAVNHKIQGGAQQMIQHAMMNLRRPIRELQDAGLSVRWSLQVHDALQLRMKEEEVEVVRPVVEDVMVNGAGIRLRVPVVVETSVATSWGDL
jgi:DNA polymerase-1